MRLGYPLIDIRSPLEFLKDENKEKKIDTVAFSELSKKN